jgi:hypothetical protein
MGILNLLAAASSDSGRMLTCNCTHRGIPPVPMDIVIRCLEIGSLSLPERHQRPLALP